MDHQSTTLSEDLSSTTTETIIDSDQNEQDCTNGSNDIIEESEVKMESSSVSMVIDSLEHDSTLKNNVDQIKDSINKDIEQVEDVDKSPASSSSSSSSSSSLLKNDSTSTSSCSLVQNQQQQHPNTNQEDSKLANETTTTNVLNHEDENCLLSLPVQLSIGNSSSSSGLRKNTMACEMCNNYEIQLQDIQYREAVLNLKIGQYEKNIKQLKEELKKEQTFRLELEEKYIDESKNFETDIKTLSSQVDQGKTRSEKLIIKFNKMEKRANDLVADLINQIEALKKEIQRLAIDNEKLLGRHLKKSQEMQSESISLPEELEPLQFYCLQLRENLIQALYNKEHLEESLRSENMFLKEQLLGEQQSKENMEENFSHENELLTSKVQTLEQELKEFKRHNEELKTDLDSVKGNYNHLSSTSTNRIKELEEKCKELQAIKTKSETDISSLKAKVAGLQVDLDNSEQVQRDFVKLSQSLQVQLEKIRQADTEVRWQHEEDVTECNGCKKTFHSRKEKINCSHCGRIFCLECCSKLIHSGPKMRSYKVCQVCHTLLDNQTACWFVNEAPQSPT